MTGVGDAGFGVLMQESHIETPSSRRNEPHRSTGLQAITSLDELEELKLGKTKLTDRSMRIIGTKREIPDPPACGKHR